MLLFPIENLSFIHKNNTAKLLEEINPKGAPKRETQVNIFVISTAALSNFRI